MELILDMETSLQGCELFDGDRDRDKYNPSPKRRKFSGRTSVPSATSAVASASASASARAKGVPQHNQKNVNLTPFSHKQLADEVVTCFTLLTTPDNLLASLDLNITSLNDSPLIQCLMAAVAYKLRFNTHGHNVTDPKTRADRQLQLFLLSIIFGKALDVNYGVVCTDKAGGGGGGCQALAKGEDCLNSNKLIRSISQSRSTSSTLSWSPSCKSLLTSSSKSSSTWIEFKSEMFDEYGGMETRSHSLTLGRLYAWEKKLYQEVKEQKSSLLRNQKAKGNGNLRHDDKTAGEVDSLYPRILVAISRAESISETIHKLRDQELQPQLLELLKGLMKN
ncbi:hypothetical protein G4B88_030789 [Cannabis sativa]|uniref:DUF632 domain-containing protein n=1 Tax=Cannabis sativa TaxID=3483 RepID=A0A7J6HAL2_CANSA|nr:hypothetical protein G4B88_030789 [Cannabis sativa]